MKKFLLLFSLLTIAVAVSAENYLISTAKTSLLVTANEGERPKYQYYGARIEQADVQGIFDAGLALEVESYPAFGLKTANEKAIAVQHNDGNMTLDLAVSGVRQFSDKDGDITEITMKDKVYPFVVKQLFKAYKGTDIISTWVEIENAGKKPVTLYRFASAFFPLQRGDNWMTHFHGFWGSEHTMAEEQLTNGQKTISNKDGMCNTEQDNPSFLISMDGKPGEETGHVFAGTLAWTGNYLIKVIASNTALSVSAGINEETSFYKLEKNETFVTPEFCMTFSTTGKGGVSRAFHRWARKYKLWEGDVAEDILLNSWEGVYFNVNQKEMDNMMKEFSAIGGELFVMDDGWFGDKYPRNNGSSSLGDWMVCKEKLPEGIGGLIASAKNHNIKFGIWIEPESSNTKSELFENKPKWILRVDNRPVSTGRGGTQ
ncbi:MAG: alpha-galactosidase, partial [Bacteroidaceae bacterium]|nr:alpha-galactosidase [Bacteroidaceae bacterium]